MLGLDKMKGWLLLNEDDREWRWLILYLLRRATDRKRDLWYRRFFLNRALFHFNSWKDGKSFFRVARLMKRIKKLHKELGLLPTEPKK